MVDPTLRHQHDFPNSIPGSFISYEKSDFIQPKKGRTVGPFDSLFKQPGERKSPSDEFPCGGFPSMALPQNGWFLMENPIVRNGWWWLGVPPMTKRKPPISSRKTRVDFLGHGKIHELFLSIPPGRQRKNHQLNWSWLRNPEHQLVDGEHPKTPSFLPIFS